jgi:hypothetical protein
VSVEEKRPAKNMLDRHSLLQLLVDYIFILIYSRPHEKDLMPYRERYREKERET